MGSDPVDASGYAVTQMPLSGPAEAPETVPEICPSGCRTASIDAVVLPMLTGTVVAVPWMSWSLYHCGARPGVVATHCGSPK